MGVVSSYVTCRMFELYPGQHDIIFVLSASYRVLCIHAE